MTTTSSKENRTMTSSEAKLRLTYLKNLRGTEVSLLSESRADSTNYVLMVGVVEAISLSAHALAIQFKGVSEFDVYGFDVYRIFIDDVEVVTS